MEFRESCQSRQIWISVCDPSRIDSFGVQNPRVCDPGLRGFALSGVMAPARSLQIGIWPLQPLPTRLDRRSEAPLLGWFPLRVRRRRGTTNQCSPSATDRHRQGTALTDHSRPAPPGDRRGAIRGTSHGAALPRPAAPASGVPVAWNAQHPTHSTHVFATAEYARVPLMDRGHPRCAQLRCTPHKAVIGARTKPARSER